VAGDTRQAAPDQPPREEMFLSSQRFPGQEMAFLVRTDGDPADLGLAVTRAIRQVDPEQPVFGVMPMEKVVANASAERRFSLLLLTLFAGLALLLSAIGIYGVMAYNTTQRRHEIGIRMALGAQPGMVFRLIMREGSIMLFAGLALGLLLAAATGKILSGILFEVGAFDPPAFASAFTVLAAATLLATWLPARRATRINPMIALRTE
jgi:putative ABC transport system permease protein